MATLTRFQFIPRIIDGTPSFPGARIPDYTLVSPGGVQQGPAGGFPTPRPAHDSSGLVGAGVYYDIVEQPQGVQGTVTVTSIQSNLNGYVSAGGAGKRVGVIAYDYVQQFWSVLWLVPGVLLVNNGYVNDLGAIKDFVASLPLLPATNPVEFNDAYAPAASLPSKS